MKIHIILPYRSASLYREAAEKTEAVLEKIALWFAGKPCVAVGISVSPADNRYRQAKNVIGLRLEEDLRALRYGADIYTAMAQFADYHRALLAGENTDALWREITGNCRKLTGYTYGVWFRGDEHPELNTVDAMERSQLKTLYLRCLGNR